MVYIYIIDINTLVNVETRCCQHCLLLVSRFKVVVSFWIIESETSL